jgi:hypothetical protein
VLVDLFEPVADKLFLAVGDPALVGFARMGRAGVIDAITASRAARRGPGRCRAGRADRRISLIGWSVASVSNGTVSRHGAPVRA